MKYLSNLIFLAAFSLFTIIWICIIAVEVSLKQATQCFIILYIVSILYWLYLTKVEYKIQKERYYG